MEALQTKENRKQQQKRKTKALCLMLVAAFMSFPLRQNSSCINHFQDASPLGYMPVQLPCTCKIH